MTEQAKKYHLYAIKTADLPKDGLKAFDYSLCANGRYALVYTAKELPEPYRLIREDIGLTADESAWLLQSKLEINAKYVQENKEEIADGFDLLLTAVEKELKAEKEKLKGDKKNADS